MEVNANMNILKPFFCYFFAVFFNIRQVSWPIMTCPLFRELFIALIAKEFYSALCLLVLYKKTQVKKD